MSVAIRSAGECAGQSVSGQLDESENPVVDASGEPEVVQSRATVFEAFFNQVVFCDMQGTFYCSGSPRFC